MQPYKYHVVKLTTSYPGVGKYFCVPVSWIESSSTESKVVKVALPLNEDSEKINQLVRKDADKEETWVSFNGSAKHGTDSYDCALHLVKIETEKASSAVNNEIVHTNNSSFNLGGAGGSTPTTSTPRAARISSDNAHLLKMETEDESSTVERKLENAMALLTDLQIHEIISKSAPNDFPLGGNAGEEANCSSSHNTSAHNTSAAELYKRDSKEQLKHPGPGTGLRELLKALPDPVWIEDKKEFENDELYKKDCKALVEILLKAVFKENALIECTLTGKHSQRPGLDENAVLKIVNYVIYYCKENKDYRDTKKGKLNISRTTVEQTITDVLRNIVDKNKRKSKA